MGAPKKADWREERRKQAWKLKEQGWPQQDIAVALGVSEGAVSHWMKRGREGGIEALEAHPPTGVSPRLTAEQKAHIPELLAKGAESYGFRGDVWTARRVTEVIAKTFGVRYHRDHVGRLMREAGWSRQKPIERASQRNEEALKQWSQERWPALKKPSGQRCRLSSSGPALFEGSEQGLALVTKTKARELLALSDGGLPSQFAPAGTVKPGGALFQVLAMGRILLPPGRVGHTAPVAQQIGIPVLATTHAAILRLEPANAALHVVVGAGKVLPVVALHQVRSQVGEHV